MLFGAIVTQLAVPDSRDANGESMSLEELALRQSYGRKHPRSHNGGIAGIRFQWTRLIKWGLAPEIDSNHNYSEQDPHKMLNVVLLV